MRDFCTPNRLPVEDFESYGSDEQLAKAWYRPPHGGEVRQTRDPVVKGGGRFGLKVEYRTTASPDRFYSAICRVAKWDLSGCNALRFWFQPDGSGRALLVELNIANRDGKNIHDLWDLLRETHRALRRAGWRSDLSPGPLGWLSDRGFKVS